jgi:hypothetical protein
MRPLTRARVLVIALLASAITIAALARDASASRPFSYSVMHRSTDPRKLHHWLLIKTVTGPDQPRRVTARASGHAAPAQEIEGSHGRWIVSRRTPRGRALIRTLRSDLRDSGHATLRAVGHYQCSATFRVRFRIEDYNQRAPSHFENATGCV